MFKNSMTLGTTPVVFEMVKGSVPKFTVHRVTNPIMNHRVVIGDLKLRFYDNRVEVHMPTYVSDVLVLNDAILNIEGDTAFQDGVKFLCDVDDLVSIMRQYLHGRKVQAQVLKLTDRESASEIFQLYPNGTTSVGIVLRYQFGKACPWELYDTVRNCTIEEESESEVRKFIAVAKGNLDE